MNTSLTLGPDAVAAADLRRRPAGGFTLCAHGTVKARAE
jgi:hypothetical protein